jgi:hypothetical protein
MQGLVTTGIVAAAILLILLAGYVLEVTSWNLVMFHEAPILKDGVHANQHWFALFAKQHETYMSGEELENLNAAFTVWQRAQRDLGDCWRRLTFRKRKTCTAATHIVSEWKAQRLTTQAHRRLHAFLVANVVTLPANTRLELFADEYYFWQSTRVLAWAFALLVCQTVIALFWRLIVQTINRPDKSELPPGLALNVLIALGIELGGLGIAIWLVGRAYRALTTSLFALNYSIFSREISKK